MQVCFFMAQLVFNFPLSVCLSLPKIIKFVIAVHHITFNFKTDHLSNSNMNATTRFVDLFKLLGNTYLVLFHFLNGTVMRKKIA